MHLYILIHSCMYIRANCRQLYPYWFEQIVLLIPCLLFLAWQEQWSGCTSSNTTSKIPTKHPLDQHCRVKGIAIKLRMQWGKYSQHAIKCQKPKCHCPTPITHGQDGISMWKTGCHCCSPLQPTCHFKSEPQKTFASFNRWSGQSGHGQFNAWRYRLNR